MIENKKFSVMIVPTGVGASIGGYAGDASKQAQKIAKEIPLIVNPNIVNAAVFSGITENMLYVEGWVIEQLFKGNISLIPSVGNKIGLVFDKAISQDVLNVHINTLSAIKTVYDIDIIGYEITENVVGVDFFETENSISSGSLLNPEVLKDSAKLLLARGANAIAVVCSFNEPPEDDYEKGVGIDLVGGVEAVISHYLSSALLCPCVHAPAFDDISINKNLVDSKVAAEYITPTFLPCLLFGLKNAPLIKRLESSDFGHYITYKDIHSVCVPCNALGSSVVLDAITKNIPVVAIKENTTVLDIDKFSINKASDIIELKTYDEYVEFVKRGHK